MASRNQPSNAIELSRALFEPWRYEDDTEGFRWDPIEDRRYAHQFGDPSENRNKIGSVSGANRLAAMGFATLVSAPTAIGLATLGVFGPPRPRYLLAPRRGANKPRRAISTSGPSMAGRRGAGAGVGRLWGASDSARPRPFQVGKFFNFERARVQFL